MVAPPGPELSSQHSGTPVSSPHGPRPRPRAAPSQQLPSPRPPGEPGQGQGGAGGLAVPRPHSSRPPQLQRLDLFLAGGFPARF